MSNLPVMAQPSPTAPGTSTLVDLPELATQANAAHRVACNAASAALGPMRVALDNAISAGRALREAKGQIKHGQWLSWLAEHCPDISSQRASEYMRLADAIENNALDIPNSGTIALSRAIAALPKQRRRSQTPNTVNDRHPIALIAQIVEHFLDLDETLEVQSDVDRLPELRVAAVTDFCRGFDDDDREWIALLMEDWARAIFTAVT